MGLSIKSKVLLKAGATLKQCGVAQGLVQAGFEDLQVPRFHTVLGNSILVLSYSLLFCSLLLSGGFAGRENYYYSLSSEVSVSRTKSMWNSEWGAAWTIRPSYRVDGPWHIFSSTSLLFSMSGTDGLRVSLFSYPACVSQTVKPSISVNLDGDL